MRGAFGNFLHRPRNHYAEAFVRVSRPFAALILGFVAVSTCTPAFGQPSRIIPVEDWTYTYLERLQRRGHLLTLSPTALPYREGEVVRALAEADTGRMSRIERRWTALLSAALSAPDYESDEILFGGGIEAGFRAINSDRLDVLRPTDEGDPALVAGPLRLFPNVTGRVTAGRGPLVAQMGLRHDLYYRDDPDGIRPANRLITRNSDSYVGFDGRFASVYLGRFSNHWAVHGEDAPFLSANPAAYDQMTLRIGGRRLAVRSILGELDSITADDRFTGAAGADSVAGSKRRFLAAHRIDWRPAPYLSITFMEASLYSGAQAAGSLKYLNPLLVYAFAVDNRPKNEENNGLVAGSVWLQLRPVTLHGQLVIDDIDLMSETGEPPSVALTGALYYAGPFPAIDLGAAFTIISARAYNTHQTEGQYVYLLRGLATQFNDFVHLTAFADVYADRILPGLHITPRLDLLLQGEADPRQPYPEHDVAFVLTGDVARTLRTGARVRFQNDPRWWVGLDYGANFRLGEAQTSVRLIGLLEFGMRMSITRGMK
jgi:hypothetical protein